MSQRMMTDESLERLLERIEREDTDAEDDPEAALDHLIDEIADIRAEPVGTEHVVRMDEFVCQECNLILNRVLMAPTERPLCVECAPTEFDV